MKKLLTALLALATLYVLGFMIVILGLANGGDGSDDLSQHYKSVIQLQALKDKHD